MAAVRVTAVAMIKVTIGGFINSLRPSSVIDNINNFIGRSLYLELVSSELDAKTGQEKQPIRSYARKVAGDDADVVTYEADFDVPAGFGEVGAVLVTNEHHREIFLEGVNLSSPGADGPLLAIRCNSWVQPKSGGAPGSRVFFANKVRQEQKPGDCGHCTYGAEKQSINEIEDFAMVYQDLGVTKEVRQVEESPTGACFLNNLNKNPFENQVCVDSNQKYGSEDEYLKFPHGINSYTEMMEGILSSQPDILDFIQSQECDTSLSELLQDTTYQKIKTRTEEYSLSNTETVLEDFETTEKDNSDYLPMEAEYGGLNDYTTDDNEDVFNGMNGMTMDDDEENNWQLDLFNKLEVQEKEALTTSSAVAAKSGETHKEDSTNCTQSSRQLAQNSEQTEVNGNEELTEEEIEEFLRSEKQAASEGNNAPVESKYTPQVGMEFASKDDAHHFFSFYAMLAGFSVVVTHIKTNCPVVMVVKEDKGIWKISRLDLDHNHNLEPETKGKLFSGRKYMTDSEKGLIRTLNDNNIETRKMIAILSYLRGGITALPYSKKDVSNYRTKINRQVTGNDMMQSLDFFRERKKQDPTFFYKFDVDDNMMVKNLFWCDASSVKYYADYGDCVSFDTTYMTNKYNLPFAPFVGITGHGHTCLFGCAFLSDETAQTFNWVFETFLEAMGGKHPETIITDQDGAMRSAIQKVFPNTTHRNSLFHIKKKCYDKNIRVFGNKKNKGLVEEFEDIMNNSLTITEFDRLWKAMIKKFSLEDNNYFRKMWDMRERFVPVYFKYNFCPFLHSTARSEGTNSRFKDNVGPTYSITSFLKEYQRIVDTINDAEENEDKFSSQKRPKDLWGEYYIEQQAMELYNRNIFRKFQVQLKATSRYTYRTEVAGQEYIVFQRPNHPRKEHRPREYTVLCSNSMTDFSCICGKFQKDGILCAHILKIIIEENLPEIPEKYIIDRWRKKDRKIRLQTQMDASHTHQILRFNMLSRKIAILASKGSKKEDTCQYLLNEFERLEKEVDVMLMPPAEPDESNAALRTTDVSSEHRAANEVVNREREIQLQDPNSVKSKGRPPKSRRLKSAVEKVKERNETSYHCSHCNGTDHNVATCQFQENQFGNQNVNKQKKTKKDSTPSPSSKSKSKKKKKITADEDHSRKS
ncbi:hypothetical protein ACP70R_015435 [Stipagrostis hirtigluma subsp. patula]